MTDSVRTSVRTEKEFFAELIANGGVSNIFLNGGTKIQGCRSAIHRTMHRLPEN
jgi:hypothetical protein